MGPLLPSLASVAGPPLIFFCVGVVPNMDMNPSKALFAVSLLTTLCAQMGVAQVSSPYATGQTTASSNQAPRAQAHPKFKNLMLVLNHPYDDFRRILGKPTEIEKHWQSTPATRYTFKVEGCERVSVYSDPTRSNGPTTVFKVEVEFAPTARDFQAALQFTGLGKAVADKSGLTPGFKSAGTDKKGVRYNWVAAWIPGDQTHRRHDLLSIYPLAIAN